MAFGDDFSINAAGDIRHTSGTTVYTVQALHEWLQDLADDAQATGTSPDQRDIRGRLAIHTGDDQPKHQHGDEEDRDGNSDADE